MEKKEILLIILVSIATFLAVYSPHFSYPLPYHIDEWHHITEAEKLKNSEYSGGSIGFRVGFHLILGVISYFFNLVSIYQFLPAVWAVVSGLTLFFVAYKKTGRFEIGIFAMLFFASIKSNVNITGLWFFTALTFSIPFIFLYFYFFTEGIEKNNKKYLYLSFLIMIFLIFVHSISFLFSLPILAVYCLMHRDYCKKNYKLLSLSILIPVVGILFYKYMISVPFSQLLNSLIQAVQFKKGWGVLELKNSFFEVYSLTGYILALVGTFAIFTKEKNPKKYLVFIIWPAILLLSILVYRLTDISYLSPYQRNLYYFAISMPLLSAFGLNYIIKQSLGQLSKHDLKETTRKYIRIALLILIIAVTVILTFRSYSNIPEQITLYKMIEEKDLKTFEFIRELPKSAVMAPPDLATALYPLAGQNPLATISFYGNREDIEVFFLNPDCNIKKEIIEKYEVEYVLSRSKVNCGWKLIYDNENLIYKI